MSKGRAQCLECGARLTVYLRLRDAQFCSDAHRRKFQEQQQRLALERLREVEDRLSAAQGMAVIAGAILVIPGAATVADPPRVAGFTGCAAQTLFPASRLAGRPVAPEWTASGLRIAHSTVSRVAPAGPACHPQPAFACASRLELPRASANPLRAPLAPLLEAAGTPRSTTEPWPGRISLPVTSPTIRFTTARNPPVRQFQLASTSGAGASSLCAPTGGWLKRSAVPVICSEPYSTDNEGRVGLPLADGVPVPHPKPLGGTALPWAIANGWLMSACMPVTCRATSSAVIDVAARLLPLELLRHAGESMNRPALRLATGAAIPHPKPLAGTAPLPVTCRATSSAVTDVAARLLPLDLPRHAGESLNRPALRLATGAAVPHPKPLACTSPVTLLATSAAATDLTARLLPLELPDHVRITTLPAHPAGGRSVWLTKPATVGPPVRLLPLGLPCYVRTEVRPAPLEQWLRLPVTCMATPQAAAIDPPIRLFPLELPDRACPPQDRPRVTNHATLPFGPLLVRLRCRLRPEWPHAPASPPTGLSSLRIRAMLTMLAAAFCAVFALWILARPADKSHRRRWWDGPQERMAARAGISLADDFRAGLRAWPGADGGGWTLDATGFAQPAGLALYRPSMNLSDYTMEFLGQIDSKALSWVFRAQDTKNYYAAKLSIQPGSPGGFVLRRYSVVDGHATPAREIAIPSMPVRGNTLIPVRLEALGADFSVLVQQRMVDSWSDPRLKSGGIGFFSDHGENSRIRWVRVEHQYDVLGKICAFLSPSAAMVADPKENQQ